MQSSFSGHLTRSSATVEIARVADDADFCVKLWCSTLNVTQGHPLLCQSTRTYDFLLALRSNLTSIFNRSWDITPSLDTDAPPFFQVELEKGGWEYVDMLCRQGVQIIGLFNRKLKSALKCTVWSQCTPVPDRQTDGRTNIMAIARRLVLTNASRGNDQTVDWDRDNGEALKQC